MADVADTLAEWSSTTDSNTPAGSTAVGTNLAPNLREIQGVVVRGLSHKGSDIASAATTDIGAVEGLMHDITGTTTITAFGTVRAGILKVLKYEGALTLTHNATSLILLGGESRTTANGDTQILMSEGSGNWREIAYFPVAINPAKAVSTDETQTLTNKTLTSPVLNTGVSGTAVADAATTLTGSSTSTVLTPGGFAGNKSLAADGYYKLPGGLILQWGTMTTSSAGPVAETFPVAFSTLYSLSFAPLTGSVGASVQLSASPSTTGFSAVTQDSSANLNGTVYWMAVGV